MIPCRLAPGEFLEFIGAGVHVGSDKDDDDRHTARVGDWIHASEGDEVVFTPKPVNANGRQLQVDVDSQWWYEFITDRLSLSAPLPADANEREQILKRAVQEIFGEAPTNAEVETFVADQTTNALDELVKRLATRAGVAAFSGMLQSGETKFRVLPIDPNAAKRPRAASNPGRYVLSESAQLIVSRRPVGERIVNEARIQFSSKNPDGSKTEESYELKLPDGYETWAVAWKRGVPILWQQQQETIRSYDFTDPAHVRETNLSDPASLNKVPDAILDALRKELGTLNETDE